MAGSTFDVSFSGQLVGDADLAQVKNNVATLFKTEVKNIEVMFSGKRVVIKRNLDQPTALKYQAAMKNAGAICEVTESKPVASQEYSAESPPPPPPYVPKPDPTPDAVASDPGGEASGAKATVAAVSSGEMDSVSIAPPGETIIEYEAVPELHIDISALSMDDSRQNLVEHTRVPEPDINISAMSIDDSDADLVQYEPVAEPEIDISSMSIDESGEDLIEHKEVKPLEVDTSKMKLDESGEDLIEHKKVKPLEVDTSKMSVAPPGSPVLENGHKT